jgi:hypothetical protein
MDFHLRNTLYITDELKKLVCPICGKSPSVEIIGRDSYNLTVCHSELEKLCDEREQQILAEFKASEPPQRTVKIRKPPLC